MHKHIDTKKYVDYKGLAEAILSQIPDAQQKTFSDTLTDHGIFQLQAQADFGCELSYAIVMALPLRLENDR